jgi:hypothetical protein
MFERGKEGREVDEDPPSQLPEVVTELDVGIRVDSINLDTTRRIP